MLSPLTKSLLFTLGTLLAPALGSVACFAAEDLELFLDVTAEEITLHEPIFLQATLLNSGRTPIEVDLGANGIGRYYFALVDSEGRRIEAPPPIDEGFYFEDQIGLEEGESHNQRLLLDLWFQIDEPGEYQLDGWFLGNVVSAEEQELQRVEAQPLTLKVLPRSEDRLEDTCRRLAATATELQNMDRSLEAARALSMVEDPVAVSSLIRVLKSGFLPTQHLAVQGLKRTGGKQAVEALAETVAQGGAIGREARSALEALRRREDDPEILKMIVDALQLDQ